MVKVLYLKFFFSICPKVLNQSVVIETCIDETASNDQFFFNAGYLAGPYSYENNILRKTLNST